MNTLIIRNIILINYPIQKKSAKDHLDFECTFHQQLSKTLTKIIYFTFKESELSKDASITTETKKEK